MAVVSVPAYPEATALRLVAEEEKEESDMDEMTKKLAEAEARLQLAEEKAKEDAEKLKEKEDELNAAKKKVEEAEAAKATAEEKAAEQTARLAELEAQVAELTPYKAEAETLKAEKAASELAAKQQELTAFAEAQGLDPKADAVVEAIKNVDHAALIAEVMKQNDKKHAGKITAAYIAPNGMAMNGEYGDLLSKA